MNNKFDNAYNNESIELTEGKFKSLATAGMLGLGAMGAYASPSEVKTFAPIPYTHVYRNTDQDIYNRAILMVKWGEGYKEYAYDANGPTIGYGTSLTENHNIKLLKKLGYNIQDLLSKKVKIKKEDAEILMDAGIKTAISDARAYLPNFDNQPLLVQATITDMAYNLGIVKLNKFKNMRNALMSHDYYNVSEEMQDSKWHRDVKRRAYKHEENMERLAKTLKQPRQKAK